MRCSNEVLMKLITEKSLTKSTQVHFSVLHDLPDCRRIKAKNFAKTDDTAYTVTTTRPENKFQCFPKGCVNTGTLNLTATKYAAYKIPGDAREVAAGAFTFYVKPASYPATVTVTFSATDTFAAADVYTLTYSTDPQTDDGYIPVTIDLTTAPDSQAGGGWAKDTNPVGYVKIEGTVAMGISSLAFFESILDFDINDVVTVGCLSSMGGSFDVGVIESRCTAAGYDDNITSLSFPVTGNNVSSNWMLLNPLLSRGEAANGFEIEMVEKTVEAITVDGTQYGVVHITDAADDCGYYAVQPAEDCDARYFTRVSVPNRIIALDDTHFQVMPGDDVVDILMNGAYIGKTVRILYPKTVEVEELVANVDNLNTVRTRMFVQKITSDGTKYNHIFDNVFVTSFPASLSESDTEFSFTITVVRDDDGNFFRIQKVAA